MRYEQFLDIVLGRCRSLNFLGLEGQQVDAGEVELAAYNALLDLNDGWDLDAFTVVNDRIAVTVENEPDYALPADFGRLIIPREDNGTGIFILVSSGSSPTPLRYRDHEDWYRRQSTSTGQPSHFTISNNDTLKLDPIPDSNSSSNYTIQGVYIRGVQPLDDNNAILVSHPTALITGTLMRMAIDRGAPQTAALAAERNIAASKMVNNQARIRQQFRHRHNEERSMRRGRW